VPAHNHRGFTLVEVLVALVLSGIITGVIFQFLVGQGQFSRLQTAQEEVQDNTRHALEVISAELRGVGVDAISAFTPQSVTFRTPRAWGIVCGYASSTTIHVLFPASVRPALRLGADALAVPPVGTVPTWQFAAVSDATNLSGNIAAATLACNTGLRTNPAIVAALTADQSRARTFTGAPAGVPVGSRVYVYDEVTYAAGTAADAPGTWILRNAALLAGPLPSVGGLRFAYFTAANTSATVAGDIRSVRVVVATNSTAKFGGSSRVTADSTMVFLRNRN